MDITFILLLLVLGAVVGFAAGLLGIGGGMLLTPFLTMLFTLNGMPADLVVHAAVATSMGSILFTSLSSTRAHHKRGAVRWPVVWALVPGIIIGGLVSGGAVFALLPTAWLALVFGIFVAWSALKMLSGRPPKPERSMPGPLGTGAAGAGIGFVSGLVGAGGGFLSVPFMVRCNVLLPNAIATSAALGFPIALANTVGYVASGWQETAAQPGMLGYVAWPSLLVLVASSMLTAPLGAAATHRLPVKTLKRIFAFLLFGLAGYMLWKSYTAFVV